MYIVTVNRQHQKISQFQEMDHKLSRHEAGLRKWGYPHVRLKDREGLPLVVSFARNIFAKMNIIKVIHFVNFDN